jgi:hypothetical protein
VGRLRPVWVRGLGRGQTLAKQLQYAAVWGTSSKHYPQRCGAGHVLEDGDVVQVRHPLPRIMHRAARMRRTALIVHPSTPAPFRGLVRTVGCGGWHALSALQQARGGGAEGVRLHRVRW